MVPLEIFYFTSLAVYTFFIFLAFFVYQRSGHRTSGRIASLFMISMAVYVSASVFTYDITDPGLHILGQKISWVGAAILPAVWMHMALSLYSESKLPRTANSGSTKIEPRGRKIALSAAYGAAAVFVLAGTILPDSLSSWLWNFNGMHPSPWPYCLWIHYWINTGPYFDTYTAYFALTAFYSLAVLGLAAVKQHRATAEADLDSAIRVEHLTARNKYIWLAAATGLLVTGGVFLAIQVNLNLVIPDSLGQTIFLPMGIIVALVVSRHQAFVSAQNVARDFYRAASSVLFLFVAVSAFAYFGEGGSVSKTTLLVLVTLIVVFFMSIGYWWKMLDSLLLGPRTAAERAEIRSSLDATPSDPDLMRLMLIMPRWSKETQRVFILLGEGMGRQTIAKDESMHVSTVDLHVRRIKDALEMDKLEDVRALSHKLQLEEDYVNDLDS